VNITQQKNLQPRVASTIKKSAIKANKITPAMCTQKSEFFVLLRAATDSQSPAGYI
jgi:hypothetical protein